MNTTHLIGAEEVTRASFRMQEAAATMQQAADDWLSRQRHRCWADDWLSRQQANIRDPRELEETIDK